MTRLENVIAQVKDARKGANKPWIFNDDGKIADNVMCCEVLDVLEELKKYEPSLEVEEAEDAIYSRDMTDVTDIIAELLRNQK